jgi:hypothetical protein
MPAHTYKWPICIHDVLYTIDIIALHYQMHISSPKIKLRPDKHLYIGAHDLMMSISIENEVLCMYSVFYGLCVTWYGL